MDINISQMSTEEKMRSMELLWDDLCSKNPDFNSPDWHRDLLKSREKRIREGKEKFLDWEQAKKEIWDSLSLRSESWNLQERI